MFVCLSKYSLVFIFVNQILSVGSEEIISNLTIISYADINNYIRMNITWNYQTVITENFHLTIKNIENNMIDCFYTFGPNEIAIEQTSIINPNLALKHPADTIKPGCKYQIILQNSNYKKLINFTIPECVEKNCDCNKYQSHIKLIEISSIFRDEFLVKWQFINDSFPIKDVTFNYKKTNVIEHSNNAEIILLDLKNNSSKICLNNLDYDDYTLFATFINNYNCYTYESINFNVQNTYNYLYIVIIVLVILIILWEYKIIINYIKKFIDFLRIRYKNDHINTNIVMQPNITYIPMEIVDKKVDHYEISRNSLLIIEEIGRGAFGHVYSGRITDQSDLVAIKMLKENAGAEEIDEFLREIIIFKKIGKHPNIVNLIGCCTLDIPFMMIMEYVPCGDLKHYLLELREEWMKRTSRIFFPDNSDCAYIAFSTNSSAQTLSTNLDNKTPSPKNFHEIFDVNELKNFALQIAKGMAHLESIQITHRDLAARNILINEEKNLKISDFGLSRNGPYTNNHLKKLPLRWMALESIIEHHYDNKSDVWSYGIVLWEIGTLGAFPYQSTPDTLIIPNLQMGNRLKRPEICTDFMYDLMQTCWDVDPKNRPTFAELVDMLSDNDHKIYVDFGQLNPSYVFPPTDR